MTEKEAKKIVAEGICDNCSAKPIGTSVVCNACKYFEAVAILFNSADKQIPKKPINGCCPDCGVLLKKFAPYTYCAKCGRKLDAPWCEV